MCGCRASSATSILSSLIFKNLQAVIQARKDNSFLVAYWSTDFRTPVIERSFFNSTVTFWSVRVLNTEKMSWQTQRLIYQVRRVVS